MTETSEPAGRQKVLAYVACYVLYVLLIVLALVLFAIWRLTILAVIGALMDERSFVRRLIYLSTTTLMALGVFVLVMVGEPYLRYGIPRRELVRRFARLAIPMAIAAVLGLLISRLVLTFS